MTRLRSSLVLLALVCGALIVSWFQVGRQTHLPAGSSYSAQGDGALALYEWASAVGGKPARLQHVAIDPAAPPRTLLLLQPESIVPESDRRAFDAIPRAGGTLLLIGDSPAAQAYARNLGVTFSPQPAASAVELPIVSHYFLRTDDATPFLTSDAGFALGLRKPYLNGTLIVVATPNLLTNAALGDDDVARFVYRTLLDNGDLTFDEAHHSYAPPEAASSSVTMNDLLFGTAVGRAVVYATLLTFAYLLLAGRRLGPPIAARGATEVRRTMYEHVQMLANLYRRAGQLATVRAAFVHHYQRSLHRQTLPASRTAALADALRSVENAQSESALVAAVADADRALGQP